MEAGLPVLFCKMAVPVLDSAVLIRPARTRDSGLRLCGAEEGEVGAQVSPVPGQQGCARGSGPEGEEKHDACGAPCGAPGGFRREVVRAVGGTADQPGDEARLGEGDDDAGDVLDTVEVGEKRDRQERATHRGVSGHRVSNLVVIGQVTHKKQSKLTIFYQKPLR